MMAFMQATYAWHNTDVSAAELRPHKKLKVVFWQRLLHLQERQIDEPCALQVALNSSAAGQNKSAAYSKEQKVTVYS